MTGSYEYVNGFAGSLVTPDLFTSSESNSFSKRTNCFIQMNSNFT